MTSSAPQPQGRSLPNPVIALGVAATVAATLAISTRGRLPASLGDTDDAMRLVMVRELAGGEAGWFAPHIARLQPPLGLDMHWSRLVDAGLVGLDRSFGLVLAPERAEAAMRFVWPLLWIFPAVWAVVAIARRLGGATAVIPAAALLVANLMLYAQWWPGRIDHHDIQITLTLAAMAGAVLAGARGGALAGAATGLCLAVGLESLPFLALAGASFALRFLFEPRAQARGAQAYAAALAVVAGLAYLAQTPPERLSDVACDALAANLLAALGVAAAGLAIAVQVTRGAGLALRLAALGLAGVAAGGVYLGLHPACIAGPIGEVDPRIQPIWLDHIREMQPLLANFWVRRSDFVVGALVLGGLALASCVWLGLRRAGRTPAWGLLAASFIAAFAMTLAAERAAHYANWFAVPLIAAALGDIARRWPRSGLVLPILVVALTCQPVVSWLLGAVPGWDRPNSRAAADRCIAGSAMGRLAGQPAGLVLGEIDLGPHILAWTPHAAVAAPYHRMSPGILAGHHALAAPAGADERAVRALGATYVAACPARRRQTNHVGLGPASLQQRLDRGAAPAWLEPLSAASEPLQVYKVRPPAHRQ